MRWQRLSRRLEVGVLTTIVVASLAAIFMNINFHLANGSPHPWLVPKDGFDEGVDLDSLLPLIQLVFVAVSTKVLLMLRRERRARETELDSRSAARPRTGPASQTG